MMCCDGWVVGFYVLVLGLVVYVDVLGWVCCNMFDFVLVILLLWLVVDCKE